jgi:membrane associated rhomboid family serine protease
MTPAPVGLRCPDHSGKPQGIQKVTKPAQRAVTGVGSRRTNIVTLTLIGINVAVVVAELGSFTNSAIFRDGALVAIGRWTPFGPLVGVSQGEWWRLVTSMFLHVSFFHIALNMYSLYYAGSILEQVIGRWRFLLLYLASGIAGSAGALVYSPLVPTVGASGAIFGVLGGLFVLERKRHISTGGQVAGLIVLNLIITFVFHSYISVGGHVGGLIAGALLMLLLLHFRRSALYSILATVGVVALSFAIAYLKVRNYH